MEKTIKNNLQRIRLGTCFNYWTRDVLANEQAFNLENLNAKNLIKTNVGKQVFSLKASSDNNSEYKSDFFGSNTNAEVGFMKWSAGVGFNMQNSKSALEEHNELNCQLSNRYIGQNVELINLTPHSSKVYYNCLMPGIKRAYKSFLEEEDLNKKLRLYFEFIKYYGTGFISRLFLESGSIANISIKDKSASTSASKKYGVTASVSVASSGVSNATDWGKTLKNAGVKGTLNVDVEINPSDSPSKDWAKEVSNTFISQGLETLTKTASFANLPSVDYTALPDYPAKKEPKDEDEPKNMYKEQIEDDIKQKILDDNDFKGTWEEYVEREVIRQATETKLENVIEEGEDIENDDDFYIKNDNPIYDLIKTQETYHENDTEKLEGSWDLEGYTPSDFIYTPWETIFPEFNAIKSIFGQNINLSKLITFQMSRVQFGQFLQYANTAFESIGSHQFPINTDANIYNKIISNYSDVLQSKITRGISNREYILIVKQLKEYLLEEKRFNSIMNYEVFYEYYNYINQCPFGMILHNYKTRHDSRGKLVYESDTNTILTEIKIENGKQTPIFKTVPDFHKQLKEALRIYLLPSYNEYKSVLFDLCFYQDGKFIKLKALKIDDKVSYRGRITELDIVKSKNKFKNKFVFDNHHSLLPTHVGFDDVDIKNIELRGNVPMFQNFPFDLVAKFSE